MSLFIILDSPALSSVNASIAFASSKVRSSSPQMTGFSPPTCHLITQTRRERGETTLHFHFTLSTFELGAAKYTYSGLFNAAKRAVVYPVYSCAFSTSVIFFLKRRNQCGVTPGRKPQLCFRGVDETYPSGWSKKQPYLMAYCFVFLVYFSFTFFKLFSTYTAAWHKHGLCCWPLSTSSGVIEDWELCPGAVGAVDRKQCESPPLTFPAAVGIHWIDWNVEGQLYSFMNNQNVIWQRKLIWGSCVEYKHSMNWGRSNFISFIFFSFYLQ